MIFNNQDCASIATALSSLTDKLKETNKVDVTSITIRLEREVAEGGRHWRAYAEIQHAPAIIHRLGEYQGYTVDEEDFNKRARNGLNL